MKGKCGHSTHRLYQLPNEKDWFCEECILEICNMVNVGHLSRWTDEQLERYGVTKE